MLSRTSVLVVAALMILTGSAAAQTFSLAIQGAPATQTITAGQSTTLNLNVNMHGEGFGCLQPQSLPVTLDVTGATSRDTVTGPDGLSFAVAQGAYQAPPADGAPVSPYNQTEAASVTVATQGGASSGYTIRLTLTANFAGMTATGCVPQDFPAAASSPVSVSITVQPDAAPPATGGGSGGTGGGGSGGMGGNGTGGGGSTGGGDEDEGGGIPTPWVAVPLAFAAAAFVLRRRG